jgi:hypothetical protein
LKSRIAESFRTKFSKSCIAAVIAALLPSLASATVMCTGQVGYLGVDQSGQVVVANGTAIHFLCGTVSQASFQISTQACKLYYVTLVANRLAGRTVSIYYNDPALTSCAQIGGWSVQNSAYFIEQAS